MKWDERWADDETLGRQKKQVAERKKSLQRNKERSLKAMRDWGEEEEQKGKWGQGRNATCGRWHFDRGGEGIWTAGCQKLAEECEAESRRRRAPLLRADKPTSTTSAPPSPSTIHQSGRQGQSILRKVNPHQESIYAHKVTLHFTLSTWFCRFHFSILPFIFFIQSYMS